MGKSRNAYGISVGSLKRRNRLGEADMNGRIVEKARTDKYV
jgi:hypothetical protein